MLAIRVLIFLFILASLFSKTLSPLSFSLTSTSVSLPSLSPLSLFHFRFSTIVVRVLTTSLPRFAGLRHKCPHWISCRRWPCHPRQFLPLSPPLLTVNYKQVTSSHFLFRFASFHDSCWFIVERFEILIMGTKPYEVWVWVCRWLRTHWWLVALLPLSSLDLWVWTGGCWQWWVFGVIRVTVLFLCLALSWV